MNYETIDRDVEATRIAAAFGAKSSGCEFVYHHAAFRLWDYLAETFDIALHDCFFLRAEFDCIGWSFSILTNRRVPLCSIALEWDRTMSSAPQFVNCASIRLARALYSLDLLTPEVEAIPGFCLSHHEKMVAGLEFEARMKTE